ncbi:S8 family serine peptidase [Chloroflexales bacterium ZM16-3]|nr:S8 family serine peptidase [Chloroflexales bacterium ZM16-3]
MSASRSAILALLMVACVVLVFQPAQAASAPQVGRYIVELRGEPLAVFAGRAHLDAGDGHDARPLDLQSQPVRAQQASLSARRQRVLDAITQQIGASPQVLYVYDMAFNGMAVELTAAQARRIADMPDILSVQPEQIYQLTTDAGPSWIGAGQIWDGSASGVYAATILGENMSPPVSSDLSGRGTFSLAGDELSYTVQISGPVATITAAQIRRASDGVVVGTLTASGPAGTYAGSVALSPANKTLLLSGGLSVSLITAANPNGAARGNIAGYQGEGVIIGMIDTGINTTHPSFTEVGGDGYRHLNPLGQGSYKGACDPTNLPSRADGNLSGYNPAISCNNKLIGAWAFSQTAPVSNFDTGEPSPNDEDGHGSHTASTAAGNVLTNIIFDGVNFPRISGVAPHANIIAYDACGYLNGGLYSSGCPSAALLAAVNQAVADQVDVISYSISGGENPWTDSVEQAFLAARAAGIVVSTSAGNRGPTSGTVAHLGPWLLSVAAATHNRSISDTSRIFNNAYGDIMADFSSRGPAAGLNASILKPDIAAPGVDVFAAYANSGGSAPDYAVISGTSMAAPHVAGAAALLAGLHPGWTPGQIQSALMTTALAPITKEDGVTKSTPFDSGAGRVRVDLAARAGLVLDETSANFSAADPDAGGDPRALNTPSMADPACMLTCSWVRTLHNTLDTPVTWGASTDTSALTVTPSGFTIPASGSQVVTFTMDVSAQPFDTYVFGRATFTASGGMAPDASFPVAALPRTSDLPTARIITSETSVATDTFSLSTIPYTSLSMQASGMVKGSLHTLNLADRAYDTSIELTVPENTARMVIEVLSSTSQDVDLFVYDANDKLACQSATAVVEEYCSLNSPTAGTYFLEVQNYQASSSGATDPVALLTAIIPQADAGNLSVDVPTSSAGGEVSLTLHVDEPASSMGDVWYGQFRLADGASLGTTNVDFHHAMSGPAALTASGGAGQRAVVNTTFPSMLKATVTDNQGGRLSGVTVTFSAPTSGASATFPSGETAITDQNGVAMVIAQANGVLGAYHVTASIDGASGALTAVFGLENIPKPLKTYLPLVVR